MASKIEIINMALIELGNSPITSLSDNTDSARKCNVIYEQIAEDVMGMGAWPSVICRAELAQDSDTPSYGYDYQYTLPTDPKCLRIISINEERVGDIDFKIERGKLLTNETEVSIQYIGKITDTESYDTYLRQGIIVWLKAKLMAANTGSRNIAAENMKIAKEEIMMLLASASMGSGSNDNLPSDTFIDVRF